MCKCNCNELKQFLFVALDYKGLLVVITDYAKYPNVFVDDVDKLITFKAPDVKDFIKPDTKLIFLNGIH